MEKIKFYLFLAFVSCGLLITGCGDDDDHGDNEITIIIEEPVDGETIANCEEIHVHVDIVASEENHELEIVLHPEGDVDDKIIDYDKHEHDQEIKFEQEVDLCSYPAGTCFHLEVAACKDHDCAEMATAEVEFCRQ